jgi:hypothetical protein
LWELLAEPCSPDELVRTLAERHALDASVAARDASAFLDALRARRLIQDV